MTISTGPRRFRFGYWATSVRFMILALITLGIVQVGFALLVVDRVERERFVPLVSLGIAALVIATLVAFYYRRTYLEIDVEHGVVRLSGVGGVAEFDLRDAVFIVPKGASVFPRVVRIQVGDDLISCPLTHQGQIASPGVERFVEVLSAHDIRWRFAH